MLGVDISYHNGKVDFKTLKRNNVEFVIVRAGYGQRTIDDTFERNVYQALEEGMKVGSYWYSYALSPNEAKQEAISFREAIDKTGALFEMPVWFDMEDADCYKKRNGFLFSKSNITAVCKVFLDNIGLDCGVYASESWFYDLIDWKSLGCAIWNASFTYPDSIGGYMWQFTEKWNLGGKLFDGNVKYDEKHKFGLTKEDIMYGNV